MAPSTRQIESPKCYSVWKSVTKETQTTFSILVAKEALNDTQGAVSISETSRMDFRVDKHTKNRETLIVLL